MSRFDWSDLETFLAVARTGRLTAAAKALGADHTTVGRRITSLERDLKVRLFDRSPAGYAMTRHGERLLVAAERMESLAIGAAGELQGADLAMSGSVRVGAPEGFGSYFLAPRIAGFALDHPDLEIELVATPGFLNLSKREADMAVTLSPPREGRLVTRKLTDYDLGLYGAPAYLDGRPPIRERADLGLHRFIGYIEDLIYAPELDYMEAPDVEIRVRLKSSNLIAQLRATLAGAGLCVLPLFIAAEEPGLVRVLPQQVRLRRSLWLTTHADLKDLARIKAVSAFIVEAVKGSRGAFTEGGEEA